MQREEILERLEIVVKIIDKMDVYLANDGKGVDLIFTK